MRFSIATMTLLITLTTTTAQSQIVYWHAFEGIPPNDPSFPPTYLFNATGSTFTYYQCQFINLHDASGSNSGSASIGYDKSDAYTFVGSNSDWAFQAEIRINSHSRPNFDWGAELGMDVQGANVRLAIARDRVGFEGFNGDSYLGGQFYSLNATNDFHLYRIQKGGGSVRLYVDNTAAPVITLPYSSFGGLTASGNAHVIGAGTSNGGVADYDVRSFGYNPSNITLPDNGQANFPFNVPDCNDNNVADSCDIASTTSQDCNQNGIPDECELPYAITVLAINNPNVPCQNCDPTRALGVPDSMTYSVGVGGSIDLQLGVPVIDNPGPDLGVWEENGFFGGSPDEKAAVYLSLDSVNWTMVGQVTHVPSSQLIDIAGTGMSGARYVRVVDTQLSNYPGFPGFDLDAITVTVTVNQDCNNNGVPDECELAGNDCNGNGVLDECELVGNDCNNNGVPDDCDLLPSYFLVASVHDSPGSVLAYRIQGTGPAQLLSAISGNGITDPAGLAFNPQGELFVANILGASISRFVISSSGVATPNGVITGNGLADPSDLSFGPGGELFVANRASDKITRFMFDNSGNASANGSISTGSPGSHGVAFSPSQELFFVFSDSLIQRYLISLPGGPATYNGSFSASPGTSVQRYMEFDSLGELFVPDHDANGGRVWRYLFNQQGTPVANGFIDVPRAIGVVVSPSRELFVSSHYGGQGIYRFILDQNDQAIPNGIISTPPLNSITLRLLVSADCNTNNIPDECELTNNDCNGNGILDECEQCGDLDNDGDVDSTDFSVFLLAFGRHTGDIQFRPCADFDADGVITLVDYQHWLACYRQFTGNPFAAAPPPSDLGDINGDGQINGLDIQSFLYIQLNPTGAVLRERFVADFNSDGVLDSADAPGFVQTLLASGI